MKLQYRRLLDHHAGRSYLIEVRGLKLTNSHLLYKTTRVVSYRGTWIETDVVYRNPNNAQSYLIEVRGLKLLRTKTKSRTEKVVSYRGTWIETFLCATNILTKSRIL